jgi:hypothetical protein
VHRMNNVVFKPSPTALFYTTALVAGLLVFVWLHWRGQRQVALVVFSVLTVLAASLYTLRGELNLSVTSREVSGKRTWLGIAVRKIVVRVGSGDALYLTEEIVRKGTQGVSVWHKLEAAGELISRRSDEPGPFILASQTWPPNRAKLVEFAERASESLGVSLEDNRKFTERVK